MHSTFRNGQGAIVGQRKRVQKLMVKIKTSSPSTASQSTGRAELLFPEGPLQRNQPWSESRRKKQGCCHREEALEAAARPNNQKGNAFDTDPGRNQSGSLAIRATMRHCKREKSEDTLESTKGKKRSHAPGLRQQGAEELQISSAVRTVRMRTPQRQQEEWRMRRRVAC